MAALLNLHFFLVGVTANIVATLFTYVIMFFFVPYQVMPSYKQPSKKHWLMLLEREEAALVRWGCCGRLSQMTR